MPWRETRDPYGIWVSEVMLQQTQVGTMTPYYARWMARFPTFEALAEAEEQDVLAYWQGLGYYRRARNLLAGARQIVEQGVPQSREEWLKIPGVGRYTAGALSSITLGLAEPVVDGNVERVYARLTADDSVSRELHERAWKWATANMDSKRPGDWNQSLMELGATVCKPLNPACQSCPVKQWCCAYQSGRVGELPTKAITQKVIRISNQVWVPVYAGLFGVRQIPSGQWWEGMWEFPRSGDEAELRNAVGAGWAEALGEVRFSVTHHRITMAASLIRCESAMERLRWLTFEQLADLPMPAPQRRVIKLAVHYLGTS
jgi:A/G-specific adenine glycosylase